MESENNVYTIENCQYNVSRVFLGKYSLSDIVKRVVADSIRIGNAENNFTNSAECDTIIHEQTGSCDKGKDII